MARYYSWMMVGSGPRLGCKWGMRTFRPGRAASVDSLGGQTGMVSCLSTNLPWTSYRRGATLQSERLMRLLLGFCTCTVLLHGNCLSAEERRPVATWGIGAHGVLNMYAHMALLPSAANLELDVHFGRHLQVSVGPTVVYYGRQSAAPARGELAEIMDDCLWKPWWAIGGSIRLKVPTNLWGFVDKERDVLFLELSVRPSVVRCDYCTGTGEEYPASEIRRKEAYGAVLAIGGRHYFGWFPNLGCEVGVGVGYVPNSTVSLCEEHPWAGAFGFDPSFFPLVAAMNFGVFVEYGWSDE